MRTQKFSESSVAGGGSGNALESASSADLQIVNVELAVNYRINTGKSAELFSTVGPGYEDTVIAPAVHEATKAAIAKFNAQDLITNREQVRADIQDLLSSKLQQYDITVQSVSIINFDFSQEFNAAIEQKVTAQQNALKEQNNLQVISFQAQQAIKQAEGQRNSTIAVAEGQAQATILNAEAEAKKVQLIQDQLSKSPAYVNWVVANKWNGQTPGFLIQGGSSPNLLLNLPTGLTAPNATS